MYPAKSYRTASSRILSVSLTYLLIYLLTYLLAYLMSRQQEQSRCALAAGIVNIVSLVISVFCTPYSFTQYYPKIETILVDIIQPLLNGSTV